MEKEGGLVVRGRVEIDMRQPFSSVKEAISIFGEKVLAGEIYANKFKEMETKENTEGRKQSRFGTVKTEIEEEKKSVEKTKEEGNMVDYYLNSLKQELEQTKKELQQLKSSRELTTTNHHHYGESPIIDPEIEQIKFIENSNKLVEVKIEKEDGFIDQFEFQTKRSVKFASPPLLTKVIVSEKEDDEEEEEEEEGDNSSPLEKKIKRKKPLIPLIGALFLKKKGSQKDQSPKA